MSEAGGTVTEYVEKAERKHVPHAVSSWLREVAGIARFSEDQKILRGQSGVAWMLSMQEYYNARLIVLGRTPPNGINAELARRLCVDVRSSFVLELTQ